MVKINKIFMRYFFIITFYIVFFLLFGLINQSKASDIIATVNGVNIFNYDVQVRLKILKLLNRTPNESITESKRTIINQLIEEKLIVSEAANYSLSVSSDEILEQIHYIESLNKWSKNYIFSQGEKVGLSKNIIQNYIYQQTLSQKLIRGISASRSQVTSQEIDEAYYNVLSLNGKNQYLISEIFVSSLNKTLEDAKEEVEKIYNNLKKGANFNIIVSSYSDNIYSKNNKGLVGWVYETELSDKALNLLNSIQKDQFTPPIFLNNGYYIFKLLDKKTILYVDTTDPKQVYELKNLLRQKLLSDKANLVITNYVADLKSKAIITYY